MSGAYVDQLWNTYITTVNGGPDPRIPYLALIRNKLRDVFPDGIDVDGTAECLSVVRNKLNYPCLMELIWSYWHEEGMLVQSMNAITRRFQNIRGPETRDPLAGLEIDPLRSANNLLWGYLQDEQHRLGIERRVYEYDHHYGFMLHGKAVPPMRAADSRSRFLEAFHNLLYLCSVFFREDDDTTVISDGFPVLNALKDVHLLLSEGAHNQFGDLPTTARIEMLMQQWILARPEFREFLPTRVMVAYPERWMDRVDAMKNIQSWTDVSIIHFHNLARVRRAAPALDSLRGMDHHLRARQRGELARGSGARRSRDTSTPTARRPASTSRSRSPMSARRGRVTSPRRYTCATVSPPSFAVARQGDSSRARGWKAAWTVVRPPPRACRRLRRPAGGSRRAGDPRRDSAGRRSTSPRPSTSG